MTDNSKPNNDSRRLRPSLRAAGVACTAVSAIGFGATPLIAALVMDRVGGVSLAFWRCALVLPPLALTLLLRGRGSFRIRPRQLLTVACLSLCGAVLTGVLLICSYRYLNTGTATTLNFSYPIFVLAMGAVFCRQRIGLRDAVCFALCAGGIVTLCGVDAAGGARGLLFALGSGLSYAVYVLYLDKSRILEHLNITQYTFWYFLLGAAFLLPLLPFCGGLVPRMDAAHWVNMTVYALLCGFACTFLFQMGVERIGSRDASLLSTVEPVVSVLLGAALLNEEIHARHIAGTLLIVLSTVILVTGGGGRKGKKHVD